MDFASELVSSVLMSGSLTTDNPVSLMLIAAPESGKTSIVTDPKLEDRVLCSDATGSGICEALITHPKCHHIIVSDMVAVMSHKETTNKRTFSILNGLTEEGLFEIALPGKAAYNFSGRKAGIVCCIPLEIVNDGRTWWQRTGFSSRFLPFCYDYSKEMILNIKKHIMSGEYEKNKNGNSSVFFPIPDKPVKVVIPEEMQKKIQRTADMIAKNLEEKGLRRGKQLRALARGHALYRKDKTVTDDDLDFLNRVIPFVSYTVPQEL